MAKFSLIGNPISHSKSPALFKAAYGEGMHTYTLLEAPTCKEAMQRFKDEGITGTNVTSPFKDEIMDHISFPDKISSILSSANTVILKEGKLHSFNTDYYGVKNTLEEYLNSKSSLGASKEEPLTALVVGAGGAGKAAALAVAHMGMEVYLANRSSCAAKPFADKTGAQYIPLTEIPLLLPKTDIIIYTLGMEIEQLKGVHLGGKIVFEANYAHPNMQCCGAEEYIDGRLWLYNQAIGAFRLFTGEEPCTQAMREAIGI